MQVLKVLMSRSGVETATRARQQIRRLDGKPRTDEVSNLQKIMLQLCRYQSEKYTAENKYKTTSPKSTCVGYRTSKSRS